MRRKFVACSAGRLLLSQISFHLEAGRVGGDEDGGGKGWGEGLDNGGGG